MSSGRLRTISEGRLLLSRRDIVELNVARCVYQR